MPLSVLVVDDDAAMRDAVRRVLLRAGHTAAVAPSAEEAVRILGAGSVDLLITDLRMPGMNGADLVREARKTSPRTAILVMTAYGTIENAVECLRRGASDYLLKPFAPEVLERAVARAQAQMGGSADQEIDQELVTAGPKIREALSLAAQAARSDATVLIEAESGTGKELLARYIHARSRRKDGPFVALNCAAVPAELLESELFGHEKGAFTGASRDRVGTVQSAAGGTLLLDEISELSLPLQAKLLRLLQDRKVRKVGSEKSEKIDVRFLASTNRRLADEVRAGRFREDLYYRLNVIPLRLPPLRERPEEIPALARHFCTRYAREWGFGDVTLSMEACEELAGRPWHGNVRELENVIQRAVAMGRTGELQSSDLGLAPHAPAPRGCDTLSVLTLDEMERRAIDRALNSSSGNRTHAARLLGISVRTLRNKLRQYREEAVSSLTPAARPVSPAMEATASAKASAGAR